MCKLGDKNFKNLTFTSAQSYRNRYNLNFGGNKLLGSTCPMGSFFCGNHDPHHPISPPLCQLACECVLLFYIEKGCLQLEGCHHPQHQILPMQSKNIPENQRALKIKLIEYQNIFLGGGGLSTPFGLKLSVCAAKW